MRILYVQARSAVFIAALAAAAMMPLLRAHAGFHAPLGKDCGACAVAPLLVAEAQAPELPGSPDVWRAAVADEMPLVEQRCGSRPRSRGPPRPLHAGDFKQT